MTVKKRTVGFLPVGKGFPLIALGKVNLAQPGGSGTGRERKLVSHMSRSYVSVQRDEGYSGKTCKRTEEG